MIDRLDQVDMVDISYRGIKVYMVYRVKVVALLYRE